MSATKYLVAFRETYHFQQFGTFVIGRQLGDMKTGQTGFRMLNIRCFVPEGHIAGRVILVYRHVYDMPRPLLMGATFFWVR